MPLPAFLPSRVLSTSPPFLPSGAGWRLVLTLALCTPTVLSGCSPADRQEAAADTHAAQADFRAYVESVERAVSRIDLSDTEFSAAARRTKREYATRLAAAERDAATATAEERADLVALKIRFAAAVDQREAAFRARGADVRAAADTARNGAYKAGAVIGHSAREAGHVIGKGAKKVGTVAKEVYEGVRDGVKTDEPRR